MQKVVGHEERPYAKDMAGQPITKRWDLLACGHALPSRQIIGRGKQVMRENAGIGYYEDYEQRKCKTCG